MKTTARGLVTQWHHARIPEWRYVSSSLDDLEDAITAALASVEAETREACAQEVEQLFNHSSVGYRDIAAAIRAGDEGGRMMEPCDSVSQLAADYDALHAAARRVVEAYFRPSGEGRCVVTLHDAIDALAELVKDAQP